jgi:6-phosphogluconolactonase/glucosamine-6-phosphate isomerase/deaminase
LSVKFARIKSLDAPADFLYNVISANLEKNKTVLWLVPGGTAIAIAAKTAERLNTAKLNLSRLYISLTDERWGAPEHSDSNYSQLQLAGFMVPGSNIYNVLNGNSALEDTNMFNRWLKARIDDCDYKLGLFGMGADGHTSGILPHSKALSSTQLAEFYDGGQYIRITTTARLISRLDLAVVYSADKEKEPALIKLKQTVDPALQPVQLLKKAKELVIFNDSVGE